MVLKRSKYGINSGNSFGAYSFGEQLKRGVMRKSSFEIMYSIPLKEFNSESGKNKLIETAARRVAQVLAILGFRDDRAASRLGELDALVTSQRMVISTLTMSLNKKNRWKIADALLDAIRSDAFGPAIQHENASGSNKETDSCDEDFGKRKKRTRQNKTERSDCLHHDNDTSVSKSLDCGVSLARFALGGFSASQNGKHPATCAVYANTDTVRRVVYPSGRGMKQRTYTDFRDALNRAYDGALIHHQENDPSEWTDSLPTHHTRRRQQGNRGVQRHVARVRKSRPRQNHKSMFWHSKRLFEYLRPIQRSEIRFSVVEPRRLTTERSFRSTFVAEKVSAKTLQIARTKRRKQLLEAINEWDSVIESEYSYESEYDEEEMRNVVQVKDENAWPVDETDSYNSSLSLDYTHMGDFESGIEPDLSETEITEILPTLETSTSRQKTYSLFDFVVKQTKRPGHKKTKRTRVNPEDLNSPKSARIEVTEQLVESMVEVEDSNKNEQDDDSTTADQTEKLWEQLVAERERGTSLRLAFCATQLDSMFLDSHFGDRYCESESTPRCVMLDLVDKVDVNYSQANLLISVAGNKDAQRATEDENVLWASVRMNVFTGDESASKILHSFTQLGSQYGTVSDIALFYLQVYDLVHSTRASLPTATDSVKTRIGAKWRNQDSVPSVSSLSHVPIQLTRAKMHLSCDAFTVPNECGICLCEPFGVVALAKCGHVFCTECLARYTIGRAAAVTLRSASIECPAFKCSTSLDAATVCSLLPSTVYFSYLRRLAELEVSRHTAGHVWCPNGKCALLLQRKDLATKRTNRSKTQTGGTVESDTHCAHCDAHFCFDCGSEAHFPATCEDRQMFVAKVAQRDQGDQWVESEFSSRVRRRTQKVDAYMAMVKHCPRCRLVMEKGEGCMHMSCRCGHQFCWVCLGDWTDHSNPNFVWDCESRAYDLKVVELSSDTFATGQKREQYFHSAILYRSAYMDQSERLSFIRSLQAAFKSSKFACNASTYQGADGSVSLEATERLLESVAMASESLVEALRFLCYLHAATFVYNNPEKSNKSSGKRMKKRRSVYWAVKKLNEPLEALRFGLSAVNMLCNELLKSETIKTGLLHSSPFCLREFTTPKMQRKVAKLIQLTEACQQQFCRSRSFASFVFECIRW